MHDSPKNGHFHERNYLLRSAFRVVHNPAAPLDAQAETAASRVSITKDVPVLRIDHISTESSLLGVWRSQLLKTVGQLLNNGNARLSGLIRKKWNGDEL